MFRFEKLEVWHMAVDYSRKIYKVCETFPRNEIFGLSSQLKRASLSISSNIAEGFGSSTNKDFSNFLDIAIKSTIETASQLLFAKEMGYLEGNAVGNLYNEAEQLVKKIQRLKQYLKKPRAISYELCAREEELHV